MAAPERALRIPAATWAPNAPSARHPAASGASVTRSTRAPGSPAATGRLTANSAPVVSWATTGSVGGTTVTSDPEIRAVKRGWRLAAPRRSRSIPRHPTTSTPSGPVGRQRNPARAPNRAAATSRAAATISSVVVAAAMEARASTIARLSSSPPPDRAPAAGRAARARAAQSASVSSASGVERPGVIRACRPPPGRPRPAHDAGRGPRPRRGARSDRSGGRPAPVPNVSCAASNRTECGDPIATIGVSCPSNIAANSTWEVAV